MYLKQRHKKEIICFLTHWSLDKMADSFADDIINSMLKFQEVQLMIIRNWFR